MRSNSKFIGCTQCVPHTNDSFTIRVDYDRNGSYKCSALEAPVCDCCSCFNHQRVQRNLWHQWVFDVAHIPYRDRSRQGDHRSRANDAADTPYIVTCQSTNQCI
eukprot:PhF_6_TR1511/c0_g2_i1/m.2751